MSINQKTCQANQTLRFREGIRVFLFTSTSCCKCMPECEFQLYKLLSVKCYYAITKITLSVLFAFVFWQSSSVHLLILSRCCQFPETVLKDRQIYAHTQRHTMEALYPQKTIKTFSKTFAHFSGFYRL